MAFDFPIAPTLGQAYGNYVWDGEKWQLPKGVTPDRATIYAAPFDALAYNGMQINGSMEVAQAGTATIINNGYIMDGWVADSNITGGAQLSFYQAPLTNEIPGLSYCLQFVVTTAQASIGGSYSRFLQYIEGYRFSRAAWGKAAALPVTVGFWARASLAGTYRAIIVNFDGTSITPWMPFTLAGGAAFQWITITFSAMTTGTWKTDNGRGASLTIEMVSSATPNLLASTSGYASIAGVVVLPGIEAPSAARSPLIMRPYDQELLTCRRYWQKIGGSTVQDILFQGYLSSASTAAQVISIQEMRASPAVAIVGPFTFQNINSVQRFPGRNSLSIQVSTAAAGGFAFYNTDGTGYLSLDARL